jgi:rubredoxin
MQTQTAAPADALVEPYPCERCGEVYDEASGDGYCGLCPSCADDDTDDG